MSVIMYYKYVKIKLVVIIPDKTRKPEFRILVTFNAIQILISYPAVRPHQNQPIKKKIMKIPSKFTEL